jgi:hypothetical protein
MAFSGGGQAITRPHTHDATILQDGGSLNMQGVTQGNLSAGSLTQSDGSNLQELLLGNPAQVLEVNPAGTAAAWADMSIKRVILDDHVAGGTEATYTFTPGVAISSANYSSLKIVFKIALTANTNPLNITINGSSNYWYYANFNYQDSTTNSWTDSTRVGTGSATFELASSTFTTASDGLVGTAEILWSNIGGGNEETVVKSFASQTNPIMWEEHTGVNLNNTGGNISSITFSTSTTWVAGSEFMIYGVLR